MENLSLWWIHIRFSRGWLTKGFIPDLDIVFCSFFDLTNVFGFSDHVVVKKATPVFCFFQLLKKSSFYWCFIEHKSRYFLFTNFPYFQRKVLSHLGICLSGSCGGKMPPLQFPDTTNDSTHSWRLKPIRLQGSTIMPLSTFRPCSTETKVWLHIPRLSSPSQVVGSNSCPHLSFSNISPLILRLLRRALLTDVPEGCVILREHVPISNLFTCLWFNEVDRFTSRDQISFSTVRDKIMAKTNWTINMLLDCERRNFVVQVTLFSPS